MPPRVEHFVMDIQECDYEVVYRPGKSCIADYLSRHHSAGKGTSPSQYVECCVKSVVLTSCCNILNREYAITLDMVKEATEKCEVMQKLTQVIRTGTGAEDPEIKVFMVPEVIGELNIIGG